MQLRREAIGSRQEGFGVDRSVLAHCPLPPFNPNAHCLLPTAYLRRRTAKHAFEFMNRLAMREIDMQRRH